MKIIFGLLTCIVFIACVSCTRLALFVTGGYIPRDENPASVTAYAIRTGLRTDNLYVFKDSAGLNDFHRTIGKLPEISFYYRKSFLMKVRNPEDCHKTIEMIIDSLDADQSYALDSLNRFQDLVSGVCHPDGNPVLPEDTAQADFSVVIYWAPYTGKINKRNTLVWEEKLYEKGKELGINVLKVDCDTQEAWYSD